MCNLPRDPPPAQQHHPSFTQYQPDHASMQFLTDKTLLTCGSSNHITLHDSRVAGATAWSHELPGWYARDAYIVHQGTRGSLVDLQHNPHVVASCVSRGIFEQDDSFCMCVYDCRMMGARPTPISTFTPYTGAVRRRHDVVYASDVGAAGPVVVVWCKNKLGNVMSAFNALKWVQRGGQPDEHILEVPCEVDHDSRLNFRLSSNGSFVLVWGKYEGMCAKFLGYGEGASFTMSPECMWLAPDPHEGWYPDTMVSVDMMDSLVVAAGSPLQVQFCEYGVLEEETVW